MSTRRLTQQDIDPVSGVASAAITPLGALVAVAISVSFTVAHWSEVVSPLAAGAAIVLVVIAGAYATYATRPSRAPVTPERLWIVVVIGVGAAVAEYLSTIGNDRYIYDDFGPLVIGVLVVSLAPFCNWLSLLTAGVLASGVLAVLIAGAANPTWNEAPVASKMFVYVAPTLTASAAAAGYAWAIVQVTLEWQRTANRVVLARDTELRAGLARSGDHGRVAVLRREVLPFLASVLDQERVSVADAARARHLADALRATLKSEIASTWLGDLAGELVRQHGIAVLVADPDSAASKLNEGQRAALTALLSWLTGDGRAQVVHVDVAVVRPERGPLHGRVVVIEVLGRLGAEPPQRRVVERFASVARAVGMVAVSEVTVENVRVELRHEIS
ncbi:hypothetical protein [Agromyces salentinus]|uniref:Uncharacterized protein n=1 Tax=Agromyces salentinus TaxID=269421 RepID=A0ABN2MVD8_9MICO|nr:hypothetical protein [Agromyces salentinus]